MDGDRSNGDSTVVTLTELERQAHEWEQSGVMPS